MTDRELLEKAAKAAGIKLHVWGTPGAENFADMDAKPYGRLWNPLTDDGDALRLAVKLASTTNLNFVIGSEVLRQSADPAGDVRRAITRAAAALADTQEGQ